MNAKCLSVILIDNCGNFANKINCVLTDGDPGRVTPSYIFQQVVVSIGCMASQALSMTYLAKCLSATMI